MYKPILTMIMAVGLVCLSNTGYAKQAMVLTTFAGPPLSNKMQTGLYDLILLEAFRRIEQPVRIEHLPAERSLTNANMGITDGDFVRISGLDRLYPNLVQVPEKIVDFEFVAFTWKSGIKLENWDSCKPFNVAIVRGWKILETNLAGAKSLIRVKNQELLFSLLYNQRTDIAVYSRFEGYEIIKRLKLNSIKTLEPPLAIREMFLYLNKKHVQLLPDLTKQLQAMKQDGTFEFIFQRTLDRYLKDATK